MGEMTAAWIFIAVSWVVAFKIYADGYDAKRDIGTSEMLARTFAMFFICIGSLWVPELWISR